MSPPSRPVYALAISGPGDRFEYLRRGASCGNLMRTADPFSAWSWDSVEEIVLWMDALPDGAKAQVADRKLLIVPLTARVGVVAKEVILRTTTPPSLLTTDGPKMEPVREVAVGPANDPEPLFAGGRE